MDMFLWWLLQNAAIVAAAIPCVWLLAHWRRLWPAEQHLLWLVLLVKLATPPIGQWPVSVADLQTWLALPEAPPSIGLPADSFVPQPPATAWMEENDVVFEDFAVPEAVESLAPNSLSAEESVEPAAQIRGTDFQPMHLGQVANLPHVASVRSTIVLAIWLAGSLCVMVVQLVRLNRQRRLILASRAASPELQAFVDRVAARMRIRSVPVRVSAEIGSPSVSCLGRTRLVWPESLAADFADLEAVVSHELAHLLRRDHWVSWLELAVSVAWWWNPAAWYVLRKLHESRELACDALSVQLPTTSRRRYAELLLHLSQPIPHACSPAPLSAGFGILSHRFLRKRLHMIFQEDAASRTSKLGLTLAVLLAAGSLPGWAWSQPAAEEPKDPMAATTADPAATPTDPKKDIEPAIEIEVKSPEETAVPTAAKKADPAASPTDPEPTARIELKSSDAVAGPVPKKSEIRLFKKDGYVVQEIPVKGNVSRLTVHRTPGGELVLVMEVDGVTTKTVLELPPSIVKAPVEAMSKAEKDTSVYIRDSLGNLWKREIEAGKMRWVHQRIDGKATADNPLGADKAPVQGSKKVSEDGKTVYVQDENGTIKAIDVASGKTLWINKSDEYSDEVFNKSLKLPPGENAPVSKKVSADGKVVQVQYDNGAVHAYDAKTGKLLWAGKKVGEEGHQKPPDPNRKYVEDNTPALFLFSDKVSTEDLELAEINLQEKQLALESAREDAAVSKDPKAHRNVKLAELSVRRAEIELSRVKAGIRQARP